MSEEALSRRAAWTDESVPNPLFPSRPAIEGILFAPTPSSWVDHAATHWRDLLVDHANCEKKAASTALALMFSYPEDRKLSSSMSRLAREELRHFEQVQRVMDSHGVPHVRQKPGRYAAGLRAMMRTSDPGRKLDLLLTGALIEARSCERFRLLAPKLPNALATFYSQLAESEARHFELYLGLARECAAAAGAVDDRLRAIAECEAELAVAPDDAFRFHSGAPA
jgi:tRNA-(ms[2]io[6]A)-hydroxylase